VGAALSFNGNKTITTSGGGALVTDDVEVAAHVRKLATQAREPVLHYEHTEVGFNYRLSNLLAALGRAQLARAGGQGRPPTRDQRTYRAVLADLPGVEVPRRPGATSRPGG
jgi:dTDP-4-amino-4,6-dideoxygalactose transaminase